MGKKKGQHDQTVYLRERLRIPSLVDEEGKRLNRQHWLLKAAAGRKNFFAHKLKNPRDILDVGSCTGIWGFEMADHFRQATVTLLDSNQHMGKQWVRVFCVRKPHIQPQLRFVEADARQCLPFDDNSFDFVHGRLLATFVPYPTWPKVVAEMVRVLRPGGWIELVEGDYPELDSPAFIQMRAAVIRFLGSHLHLHLNPAPHLREFLQDARVQSIRSRVLQVGTRESERSKLADNFVAAAQHMRPPMVEAKVLTAEEFDRLLPLFYQEILVLFSGAK